MKARSHTFAALALLAAAGCGGMRVAWVDAAGALPAMPLAAAYCLAAGDDADEIPRIVRPPLRPDPDATATRRERPLPARVGGPRNEAPSKRLGVRGGVFAIQRSDAGDWDGALRAGVYFRQSGSAQSRVGYEVGFDVIDASGRSGAGDAVTSRVFVVRYDAILGTPAARDELHAYAAGGVELGREEARVSTGGGGASRTGGALRFGLGGGTRGGGVDARVSYVLFLGSDNARDAVLATFGLAF
jgi:hypothetical protein